MADILQTTFLLHFRQVFLVQVSLKIVLKDPITSKSVLVK